MVQLQMQVQIEAPFDQVWKFFGNFQNIPAWDPNTTGCEVIRKTMHEVGSFYNIVSVFNGKSSIVSYETIKYEVEKERAYICLDGKNDMITALDQIICTKKSDNLTHVKYRADICLRGIAWLATPFIISDLKKITIQAKEGMIKKAIEMWGKAY